MIKTLKRAGLKDTSEGLYPPGPNHNTPTSWEVGDKSIMAKSKVTPEPKENQEPSRGLSESIFELLSVESLIESWMEFDVKPELDVLLALTRVARAKISYYEDKYHFEVDGSDHFYVEDMLGFAKKKAIADAKRAEHLRKQGYDVDKLALE